MSKIKDPYLTQIYQHHDLAKIMGGFFGLNFLVHTLVPFKFETLKCINYIFHPKKVHIRRTHCQIERVLISQSMYNLS